MASLKLKQSKVCQLVDRVVTCALSHYAIDDALECPPLPNECCARDKCQLVGGEMQGTVHKCLVQNHRIHAFCGVEIGVVGDNCVVVPAGEDDGSPREKFSLSSVPYARNGTGYLQICFHCLDKLRGNSAKSSHKASTSSTKEKNQVNRPITKSLLRLRKKNCVMFVTKTCQVSNCLNSTSTTVMSPS